MKKKTSITSLIASYILILSTFFFYSCTDDLNPDISYANIGNATTRSAYNNSFDWENATKVDMVNGSGNIVKGVNLPWQLGVSNMGIPTNWIDNNIEEEYSQRMYTKQNNWELVYSNINETTSYKYIVLYNKMTGFLRCFYYILSDPSSIGTTNSVWGIGINKASALFNYTSNIAEDASIRKDSPVYISTPVGTISNNAFSAVGFQNQVWYGLEIECAYDPQVSTSDDNNLYLMGRAVDKITYNGTGTSKGDIEGSITSTSSAGAGLSLNFSNMFNNNNSVSLTQQSAIETVGDKVADGVAKNDSFFTSLWKNIKANASNWAISGLEQGVKQGLSAIVSSGGSIIANTLSGLFSSISGGSNNTSKVDLKMTINSEYKFEGEKILPGWTDCTLPTPGTRLENQASKPLYNNTLGVWNLFRTPQIELYITNYQIIKDNNWVVSDKAKTVAEYYCNETESILSVNPVIANDYKVTNFTCKIAKSAYFCDGPNSPAEPALINEEKYYVGFMINHRSQLNYNYGTTFGGNKKGLVEISFNLTKKTDNNIVFHYKKYFKSNVIIKHNETRYVTEKELEDEFPLIQ